MMKGKTTLANEAIRLIECHQSTTLLAEDKFESNVAEQKPLQVIGRMLSQLLSQIQSLTDIEERNKAQLALLNKVENVAVLIDLIDDLKSIYQQHQRQVETIEKIGASEGRQRMLRAIVRLVQVLTEDGRRVCLVIHDLHWMDETSLEVLIEICSNVNERLLVIGTHRNTDKYANEIKMAQRLEEVSVKSNKISLQVLRAEVVQEWVAEVVSANNAEAANLMSQLIMSKTGGNPLYVSRALHDLSQEIESGRQLNLDALQLFSTTGADNIVSQQMSKYTKETRKLLKVCAHLGSEFDLEEAGKIAQMADEEVFESLKVAYIDGMIVPISATIEQFEQVQVSGEVVEEAEESKKKERDEKVRVWLRLRFIHDLVHANCYLDEINKQPDAQLHLNIGQFKLQQHKHRMRSINSNQNQNQNQAWQFETSVFTIANHLNIANELINDEEKLIEYAKLNLEAATKAQECHEFMQAVSFAKHGIKMLKRVSEFEKEHSKLCFELHQITIKCLFFAKKLSQAVEMVSEAEKWATKALQMATIHHMSLKINTNLGRVKEACYSGYIALKAIGVEFPWQEKEIERAMPMVGKFIEDISTIDLSRFLEMQVNDDPTTELALTILSEMIPPAFMFNQQLFSVCLALGINICMKKNTVSEDILHLFSTVGVLLNNMTESYERSYELSKMIMKISEKMGCLETCYNVNFPIAAFITHWVRPYRKSNKLLLRAFKGAKKRYDMTFLTFPSLLYAWVGVLEGRNLQSVSREAREMFNDLSQDQNDPGSITSQGTMDVLQAYMKESIVTLTVPKYVQPGTDMLQVMCKMIYLHYMVFMRQFDESLSLMQELQILLDMKAAAGMPYDVVFYFLQCLVLCQLYTKSDSEMKKIYFDRIDISIQKLQKWTSFCADNVENKLNLATACVSLILIWFDLV